MITTLRFVFFFVVSAYSFECYYCDDETSEKCNEKQTKVNCTGSDMTCFKGDLKKESGETREVRGCTKKETCEKSEKKCKDGDSGDDAYKIKECHTACCVTPDGETPCNRAFFTHVTSNMAMMMLAILLSLTVI